MTMNPLEWQKKKNADRTIRTSKDSEQLECSTMPVGKPNGTAVMKTCVVVCYKVKPYSLICD